MFVVFYVANLNICVFMTCPTSCCLYDTLMDPLNVCIYVCKTTPYVETISMTWHQ